MSSMRLAWSAGCSDELLMHPPSMRLAWSAGCSDELLMHPFHALGVVRSWVRWVQSNY